MADFEIQDLDKAYALIELGHPETDVNALAQKIYEKRIKDAEKLDPYKRASE